MDRYTRPILFAFEPKMTSVFAMINFGAAGAPSFATSAYPLGAVVSNSKGLCNIAASSVAFTGTTAAASPTITGVSSFAGLYKGMTVQDSGPTNVNQTISSMNPGAGTITLSGNATGTNTGLTATGGQYTLTFGSQFTPYKRLDAYPRLLQMSATWDETGVQGSASVGALSPAAPLVFLVGNLISSAQSASLTFQCGSGAGAAFTAGVPANGEILRLSFQLANSTAI